MNLELLSPKGMAYNTFVFIDSSVEDCDSLLSLLAPQSRVFFLSPDVDGVTQISKILQTYHYDSRHNLSIHIVSHGVPGLLYLGNTELSLSTFPIYTDQLRQWFVPSSQTLHNTLVLYGCNVAAGSAGREFIESLYQLTGASVRASTTLVGHWTKGGNWDLTAQVGSGAIPLAFHADVVTQYAGVLNGDRFYRYVENDPSLSFTTIKDTGTRIYKVTDQGAPGDTLKFNANDDGEVGLSLPFDFNFYGDIYSDVTIGVNGGIILGTTSGSVSPNNASLPDEQPNPDGGTTITPAIFPYWDDLALDINGSGDVYYEFFDDKVIVEWNDIAHEDVGDGITFQLILYKGSNEIAFVYDDVTFSDPDYDYGKTATVGLSGGENSDDGIQYYYETSKLNNITSLRFLSDPYLINNEIVIQEAETLLLTDQYLLFSDFDSDNSDINYIISNIQFGTFTLNNQLLTGSTVTFTQDDINNGRVHFIHDGGENKPSFDMVVNDQYPDPSPEAIAASITLDLVNDAPTFTGLATTLALEENDLNSTSPTGVPVVIDADVSLSDSDSSDFNGGQVQVTYSSGGGSEDQLSIGTNNDIAFDGALVRYQGETIGSVSQTTNGRDGKDLIIFLNGNATAANVEALIEALTYQNSSETPTSDRTIAITVNDGDGDTSDAGTMTISVTAENDAPVIHLPIPPAVVEDTPLTFTGEATITVSDVDAGDNDVTVSLSVTHGTLTVGDQTNSTIDLSGSVTEINAKLATMEFMPSSNFNGEATLTIDLSDQGNSGLGVPLTDRQTLVVTVNAANDAPVNTVPGPQSVNEEADLVFSGANQMTISDIDAGGESVDVTLSVNHGVLSLANTIGLDFLQGDGTDDSTVQVVGTLTAINTAISGLVYQGNDDFNGTDQLTITTNDLGNTGVNSPRSDTDIISITVNGVNDRPIIHLPEPQIISEEQSLALTGDATIQISDIDTETGDRSSGNFEIILRTDDGKLFLTNTSGVSVTDNNTETVSIEGNLPTINTVLESLTFTPTTDFNGVAMLEIQVSDQGNSGSGGTLTDQKSLQISVNAVNDRPVITVPSPQTIAEDHSLTFEDATRISIEDVDADESLIKVTLNNDDGSFTVTRTNELTSVEGNQTGQVELVGALTVINDALDGLMFAPDQDFSGSTTIDIDVDDLGNNGSGGSLTDSQTIEVNVTAVNDAPINTVPTAQFVNEDATLTFSAAQSNRLAIGDVDADEGDGIVEVVLSVSEGELTLAQVTGLDFVLGDGSADNVLSFSGSVAAINAALNGLTYRSDENFHGTDTLRLKTSDRGNQGTGGPLNDEDTISITVQPVNDAPDQIIPGGQGLNEDSQLVFSTATDNAITISDLDVAEGDSTTVGQMEVSLSVSKGTLTLATFSNLVFSMGDGTDDATVTFRGPIADINAALDGLLYKNNTDFNGGDLLIITTSDLGNHGSGGPKVIESQIEIEDTSVNDAPVITAPMDKTISEDDTLIFTDISITDVDAGSSPVRVTLSVNHGSLTLGSSSGLTLDGNDSGQITATGSLTQLNAALDGLVFTPNTHFNGIASLRIEANDQGNTGQGGELTDTAIIDITVNPINDRPTISVPGTQVVNEDTGLSLPQVSLADVDVSEGSDEVEVELGVNHGTLTLGQLTGLDFSQGDGSKDKTLTFTGSINDINTALTGLTYQGDHDFNGDDVLTLKVSDQGNTGEGGILTDIQTINITVQGVNDAPVNAVPSAQRVNEDRQLVFSRDTNTGISISDIDITEAGSSQLLEVELVVSQGILILGRTDALSSITGNSTSRVVLSGTVTAINSALDRMGYQGNPDFNGADTLTITSRDQGNTGLGGILTDIDTVAITVDAVNDIPEVMSQDQQVDEGGQVILAASIFTKLNSGDTISGLNYGVTVNPSFGRLELTSNPGVAVTTFTQTQLDNNQLVYIHDGSEAVVDSFDFVLTDGNNANGGTGTIILRVKPINDAPMISEGEAIALNVNEDSSDNVVTFNATDAEGNALSWRVASPAANGQATLFTQPTATSQAIRYVPNPNFNGSDQFTVEVSDGKGGIDIVTVNVTTASVNDIPVLLNQPQGDAFEGQNYQFIPTVEDIDGDSLTFSSPNLPTWLTLDPVTGVLGGIPGDADVGTTRLTLQAFDGNVTADILTFDLTVVNNEVIGSNQSNRLQGTDVANILYGLRGDDQLFGGGGDDQLFGNNGQDSLFGEEGQDILHGGDGRDRIRGGSGNDKLYGEGGRDILHGGNGNDTLYGLAHSDRLIGGNGNDWLVGGKGNDKLKGGKGNDVLEGNSGKNQLSGHGGKDVFVLDPKGLAIIQDFKNGQDKFAFANKNAKKLFSQFGINQQGPNTTIEHKGNIIAKIMKSEVGQIDSTDFLSSLSGVSRS